VKFILDVNALIACCHAGHQDHANFHLWAAKVGFENLHTCIISELGLLRISPRVFPGYTSHRAQEWLEAFQEKIGGRIEKAPLPKLPVTSTPPRSTDDYLCQIAKENSMRLATFDTGISDTVAEIIP
jgi:predicted nucleic acid-binding protein